MTEQISFKESINKFINTLEKDNNYDRTFFKENLKDLKIKTDFDNFFLRLIKYKKYFKKYCGQYDCSKKELLILDNKLSTFFHELLHMASSIYLKDLNIILSGFAIYNDANKTQKYVALNEGYTELLNLRYFNQFTIKNNSYRCYEEEKMAASIVEDIVGIDLMTKSYFKADIKPIIRKLYNYGTWDDLKLFLNDMDYIKNNPADINIHKFLLTAYQCKLIENLINNQISIDELITLLAFYCIRFEINERKDAIDLLQTNLKDKVIKKIRY